MSPAKGTPNRGRCGVHIPDRRRVRDRADEYWSQLIRSRFLCEAAHHPDVGWHTPADCEPQGHVEGCHIIGRGNGVTRHLLINGIALCRKAHDIFDGREPLPKRLRPLAGGNVRASLVTTLYGAGRLDALWSAANAGNKPDYEQALRRLEAAVFEEGPTELEAIELTECQAARS